MAGHEGLRLRFLHDGHTSILCHQSGHSFVSTAEQESTSGGVRMYHGLGGSLSP